MQHVVIDGGLDLVSARPAALPGRIRECLNYEVGFYRGLSRVDGFERFDGQTSPSSTNAWRYYIPVADITGTFVAVENLSWTKDDRADEAGVLLSVESSGSHVGLYVVFRNTTTPPPNGAVITGDTSGASFLLDNTSQDIRRLTDYYSNTQQYLSALSSFADTLRAEVRQVPGGGAVVGMHLHGDQLYAVRDALGLTLININTAVRLQRTGLVLSESGQLGEIIFHDSSKGESGGVSSVDNITVHALTGDGFDVVVGDKLTTAGHVRFRNGLGTLEVGDSGTGFTSGYVGEILWVDLRNGSFDAGNAEGFVAFTGLGGSYATSETVNVGVTGASFVIDRVLQQRYTNGTTEAAEVSEIATESDLAALWKSSPEGWDLAQSTRAMHFNGGTTNPATIPAATGSTALKPPTNASIATTWGLAWTGTLLGVNTVDDVGPQFTADAAMQGGFQVNHTTKKLRVRGFRVQLNNNDEITGLSLTVRGRGVTAVGGTGGRVKVLHQAASSPTEQAYATFTSTAWQTFTFGGVGSLWGERAITPALVNSDNFAFDLQGETYAGGVEIDYVALTVHIRQQDKFRFYLRQSGVDIGWIVVNSTQLVSGAWDGTGAGTFTLLDWSDPDTDMGVQIRTSPSGGGDLIGLTAGSAAYPILPGSRQLRLNNSKYQFISFNFYASEELNAIYGVSGAGPAFVYNGTTLDFIRTGVAEGVDRPRHVAAHQGRLALGYKWGEVYLSSSNNPLEYDALTLASTHGFGDKITGLMPLNGLALAVFTESSINIINGAALDSEGTGVEQRVISSRSGAIEYTVQNFGNQPVFADFQGISTIETTDQYGDFIAGKKSYDVTPWLVQRLQRKSGTELADLTVVNSVVVRHKSQYRLFFADGYVLTLTMFGQEKTPMCTIQRYWLDSDQNRYCRVLATASGVTTDGRDRAFVSIEDRFDIDMTVESGYVYELDRGNSFDGGYIESYFTLTHYFGDSPATVKRWELLQVHAQIAGVATLALSHTMNYEDMDNPVLPNEPLIIGSALESPRDAYFPRYAKARMTGRGFAASARISHLSKVEFPHIIQLLTYVDDTGIKVGR